MSLMRAPACAGATKARMQPRAMDARNMADLVGLRRFVEASRIVSTLKRINVIPKAAKPSLVGEIRFHAPAEVLNLEVGHIRRGNGIVEVDVNRPNHAAQAQRADLAG